ncbi:MAG: hypothetical protein KF773_12860 [Deltaproteobacteria bacterium]|nr:hypothetical protein [Deltaproteobacteria bacterium]
MKRFAVVVVFVVACSSPGAPGAKRPAPAAPATQLVEPAQDEPPSSAEAVRHLIDAGKLHVDRLTRAFPELPVATDGHINAFGACLRPTDEVTDVLRQRVVAWMDRETPDEVHDTAPEDLEMTVGCLERTGIIVDVHADRTKRATQKQVGHWWILRVGDGRIDRIAEHTGIAQADFSGAAKSTTLDTFLLADLDRDNLLDVIAKREDTLGGNAAGHAIAVFGSRGKTTGFAPIGTVGTLELAPAQSAEGRGTVVALMHPPDDKPARYGCITEAGYAEACTTAASAKRHDQAVEAAQRLASLDPATTIEGLPDRDELDGMLATLGVRPPARAPLLALVMPTPGLRRVTREIQGLVARHRPEDDQPLAAALRTELGDTPCAGTAADSPAVRAWLKLRPRARAAIVKTVCATPRGAYVEARWVEGPDDFPRSIGALVWVAVGAALPTIIGEAADLNVETPASADTVTFATYRRGAAAIAMVVVQGKRLVAAADGAIVGSVPPGGMRSDKAMSLYRGSDVVMHEAGDGMSWWHATETALVKVGEVRKLTVRMPAATTPVMKRVIERERRELGWQALVEADEALLADDEDHRENVLRALDLAGADPMLRAEIERAKPAASR